AALRLYWTSHSSIRPIHKEPLLGSSGKCLRIGMIGIYAKMIAKLCPQEDRELSCRGLLFKHPHERPEEAVVFVARGIRATNPDRIPFVQESPQLPPALT